MSKEIEFWRDPSMDAMLDDIVEIFTKVEGVELVRLSGMTNRARRISGKFDLPSQSLDNIIRKLYNAQIINFAYITKCPHCGETSYQIKGEVEKIKAKLCDTCQTLFLPCEGSTLEKLKRGV